MDRYTAVRFRTSPDVRAAHPASSPHDPPPTADGDLGKSTNFLQESLVSTQFEHEGSCATATAVIWQRLLGARHTGRGGAHNGMLNQKHPYTHWQVVGCVLPAGLLRCDPLQGLHRPF